MGMIGNAKDAQIIADVARKYAPRKDVPPGWKYLGSGAFRWVYLSPDGVVYKVNRYVGDEEQSNEIEYRTIVKLLKENTTFPKGTRLPRSTYYSSSDVMAMEYFEDTLAKARKSLAEDQVSKYISLRNLLALECGLGDMHDFNVMIDNETRELVPVDLAGSVPTFGSW